MGLLAWTLVASRAEMRVCTASSRTRRCAWCGTVTHAKVCSPSCQAQLSRYWEPGDD